MPALLDLLRQQIDDQTVQRISDQIGANPATTQRAMEAALPLLVGALARNADRSPEGAQALNRALEQDHDGSLLDRLNEVLGKSSDGSSLADAASGVQGGLSIDRRTVDGAGILGHILGGKRNAVELGLSRASGMDVRQANNLLPVLAPIVMSALGRLKQQRSAGAEGVTDLLRQERAQIEQETAGEHEGGLLGFLDRDDDGSIADDVARIGGTLGGSGLLGKMLGR